MRTLTSLPALSRTTNSPPGEAKYLPRGMSRNSPCASITRRRAYPVPRRPIAEGARARGIGGHRAAQGSAHLGRVGRVEVEIGVLPEAVHLEQRCAVGAALDVRDAFHRQLGCDGSQVHSALGLQPPLRRRRIIIKGQHPIEVLKRHQRPLIRHTAAHQPGACACDGKLDPAAGQLLHHRGQLGLAFGEKEVVEGPAGELGLVRQISRVFEGDVFKPVHPADFFEIGGFRNLAGYFVHGSSRLMLKDSLLWSSADQSRFPVMKSSKLLLS